MIAPASSFVRDEFDAGVAELRRLGYEPVYDETVFARDAYLAGEPALRAAAFRRAWVDQQIAALIAVRGGYGSVQVLPLLDAAEILSRTQAVHRLQRQHVDPLVAHDPVRHGVIPRTDD